MPWNEWIIDVETLKILSQHASGVVGAILLFKILAFIIDLGFKDRTLKIILESVDSVVLVGLFLWLAYQMGCLLWKRRVKNGSALCIMAA